MNDQATPRQTPKLRHAAWDEFVYDYRWWIFSSIFLIGILAGSLAYRQFVPPTIITTEVKVPVETIVTKEVIKEVPVIKEVVKEIVKIAPAQTPSLFPCSIREKEVDLNDNYNKWLTLTEGGPNECAIVSFYDPKAMIMARDGMGEFMLNPGVMRNPRAVKLIAGNGYFKYSTCPRLLSQENRLLNWDCSLR